MNEEPVMKKIKLEDQSVCEAIAKYVNAIQSSGKNLIAILSDDFTNNIPLISMYAGLIKSVKNISKAIRILNENVPLNDLNHLKRVRNNMILICPKNKIDNSIEEYVKIQVSELKDMFDSFIEISVPMYAPKLKKQHSELNKIWACNFHPDAYSEKLNSDCFFSQKDVQQHRLYMAMVFDAVLCHLKSNIFVEENILTQRNLCIVVDPNINAVVAVALDNVAEHPVQHAAMIAIDNVAKTQCGGSWGFTGNSNIDCSLNGINEDLLVYLKKQFPSVKFGAKQFMTKENLQKNEKSNADGPYLCTNYYIYCLREPCLMCAMALIHARVKRVFFCFDNPTSGALKSKTKLHTVSSLNHHYEVFTGFL